MRKSLIRHVRNGLQSRLRRFDSDPSLQSPPGQSLSFPAFRLEQAASQHWPEGLKGSRNGSFDRERVAKTTRLRPTTRFRIGPGPANWISTGIGFEGRCSYCFFFFWALERRFAGTVPKSGAPPEVIKRI
jgi:hypothetical protein